MDIEKIKAAIDELVAIIKDMIAKMTWFIEGWKQKDALDATEAE